MGFELCLTESSRVLRASSECFPFAPVAESEEPYLAVVLSKVVNFSLSFRHKSLSLLGFPSRHSPHFQILVFLFVCFFVFSKDVDVRSKVFTDWVKTMKKTQSI